MLFCLVKEEWMVLLLTKNNIWNIIKIQYRKGGKIMKLKVKDKEGSTAMGVVIGVMAALLVVLLVLVIVMFMNSNKSSVGTETVNKKTAAATQAEIETPKQTEEKVELKQMQTEPSTVAQTQAQVVQGSQATQATQAPQASAAQAPGSTNNNATTINNYYLNSTYGPYSYGHYLEDYDYYSQDADSYFLLPYSDSSYITMDDINWLISKGYDSNGRSYVQQAINELYARHNASFKKTAVQNYFRVYYERMGWNSSPNNFGYYDKDAVPSMFNTYEKANYKLLLDYRA